MTSVFYEDIKLNSNSMKSIEKCEELSKSQERAELDRQRKALMKRVAELRNARGKASA